MCVCLRVTCPEYQYIPASEVTGIHKHLLLQESGSYEFLRKKKVDKRNFKNKF